MPENKIQFQKGLSATAFIGRFCTGERGAAALERWRWSRGFVYPACVHTSGRLRTRALLK